MHKLIYLLLSIVILSCQTRNGGNSNKEKEECFIVIFTPDRFILDSMSRDDENIWESYADGVNEINQVVNFIETKNDSLKYVHDLMFNYGKDNFKFNKEVLYSAAICVRDSVYFVNDFSYEDFILEYKIHR
ncbi:MAG: hypothetical protein ABWZ25_15180 [Chitinophagaceae bacterium]